MLMFTSVTCLRNEAQQLLPHNHINDVRVIGEERDESLLLQVNVKNDTTHVMLYNQKSKSIKILYTFANEVLIHQATINQCHTILAFVTKTEDLGITFQKFQYEAWIVDLSATKFPQCLQMKSSNEITTHFRYYKKLPTKEATTFGESLIISTLKKSIILHRITKDEKLKIEKKNDVIVHQCFLSQWNATTQCLYFVHLKMPIKTADGESVCKPRLVLTGIQFHDNIHYETVLNIPLELLNNDSSMQNCSGELASLDFSQRLEVLTLDSGAVFICQQSFPKEANEGSVKKVLYTYSVTILHHGCILHGSVTDEILENFNENIVMLFTTFTENYILVILPGVFVHLLDVGLKHGPCNHVLLKSKDVNLLPLNAKIMSQCMTADVPQILFPDEMKLKSISITPENLLLQFKQDLHLSTRIAIIHQLLIHFNISEEFCNQLVSVIVKESTCLERSQLFQEFLIGKTYCLCEIGFPKDVLKLIPLTMTECKAAQIERNAEVIYTGLTHTSLTLSLSQRLRPAESDLWTHLWTHLQKLRYRQPSPFSPNSLRERLMVSMEYIHDDETRFHDGNKIEKLCSNEISLPFWENGDSNSSELEQVLLANLREMSMHISKYFVDKSPGLVDEIAQEYVSNQFSVSCFLCHNLLLTSDANLPFERDHAATHQYEYLNTIPNITLRKMFALLTDFQTSVKEVSYTLPRGFTSFFAIVAFKCLNKRMFLQYVDRGAIHLQSNVVLFIMKNLDESEENAKFKLNIILRLPKSKMWKHLELWNHEYSQEILAKMENTFSCTYHPTQSPAVKNQSDECFFTAQRRNSCFADSYVFSLSESGSTGQVNGQLESSYLSFTTDVVGSVNGNCDSK